MPCQVLASPSASSAVPGPITAPGKTPGRHTHLPKRQRPEEGEFPVATAPRPFHPPVGHTGENNSQRSSMAAKQLPDGAQTICSVRFGKAQTICSVLFRSETFWKDRTRGHSGKTEQEDILERQNKHKELTALYPRKGKFYPGG